MYAKIKDNNLILFPYTLSSLLLDNPATQYDDRYDLLGWFNQTESHLLEGYTLAEVVVADTPEGIDGFVDAIETATVPTLVDGAWTLVVTVVPLTQAVLDTIAENTKHVT
jgi:hypothetical protein